MSYENQETRELVADEFQKLADSDTFFRYNHAPLIGELIATSEPGWDVARATAALVLTDATDGFWARTAKKVRGRDVPTEGAAKDPEADHLTVESIMAGLISRSQKLGDSRSAGWISKVNLRSEARNILMDENRKTIAEHPTIDKRELRASSLNKSKMIFQVIGGVALTSPLYDKKPTRAAGIGVMQFGTWLGEVGERQYRKKVAQLIASESGHTGMARPEHLKRNRR